MSADFDSATLPHRDPLTGESVTAADDWLPKEGRSRRKARGKGSDDPQNGAARRSRRGRKLPVEAEQWLLEPTESNGAAPRANDAPDLSEIEELAELQKIEISVLVNRVEELEEELRATRKEAANAKRQATRAKKTAQAAPPRATKAKPSRTPRRSRKASRAP